jgi:hypothetical protein
MKILLSIIPCFQICFLATAQECNGYFFLMENKTVEMVISNNRGKLTGKIIYSISNSKKNGNIYTAAVQSEMIDEKGKSLGKPVTDIACENGVMKMNMKMFLPPAQQEQFRAAMAAGDAYLEYPASLNTGDKLKDGYFTADAASSTGVKTSIEIKISERKVEAKETITTPAGTWECFKIIAMNIITTRIAGIGIPIKLEVTEWFAPGFGVVKTESKTGKTEIVSVK